MHDGSSSRRRSSPTNQLGPPLEVLLQGLEPLLIGAPHLLQLHCSPIITATHPPTHPPPTTVPQQSQPPARPCLPACMFACLPLTPGVVLDSLHGRPLLVQLTRQQPQLAAHLHVYKQPTQHPPAANRRQSGRQAGSMRWPAGSLAGLLLLLTCMMVASAVRSDCTSLAVSSLAAARSTSRSRSDALKWEVHPTTSSSS